MGAQPSGAPPPPRDDDAAPHTGTYVCSEIVNQQSHLPVIPILCICTIPMIQCQTPFKGCIYDFVGDRTTALLDLPARKTS